LICELFIKYQPFEIFFDRLILYSHFKVKNVYEKVFQTICEFQIEQHRALDDVQVPEVAIFDQLDSHDDGGINYWFPIRWRNLEKRPKWSVSF
jgi:hypothetical protein